MKGGFLSFFTFKMNTTTMTKKVQQYLLISYAFAILIGLVLHFFGLYGADMTNPKYQTGILMIALLLMPSPAFAVLIIEKFQWNTIIERYDLNLKKAVWKDILIMTLSMALLIPLILLGLTYVLGDLLNISGIGNVVTSNEALTAVYVEKYGEAIQSSLNLPPGNPLLTLLPTGIMSSIIAGFTINGLVGLGEELGWRGLLMNEWQRLGWHRMNIMTGIVWGLWHSPIILLGHNYPSYPILGIAMMVVLCISMSYLFAWSRLVGQSVLAPAILHGCFNALAMTIAVLISHSHELIGGAVGLVAALSIYLTYLILKTLTQKKEETARVEMSDFFESQFKK